MSIVNDRLNKRAERLTQIERSNKAKTARDNNAREYIDKDRQQIIGTLLIEYFPTLSQFQPHRTESENQDEFAPLIKVLSALAELLSAPEYIICLNNVAKIATMCKWRAAEHGDDCSQPIE